MMASKHELSYLLKTDDEGHYVGRVLEIPAVIAYGKSPEEVESKMETATLSYFEAFEDLHQKLSKIPEIKLSESKYGKGRVLSTKQFKVHC